MATIATPIKLKSGDWGAKAPQGVRPGDRITVRTKAGKEWDALVSRVVWSGNGVSIVATSSVPSRGHGGGNGGWCNCGASEDLMSMGYGHLAGRVIRCPSCGKKAEVA